MDVTHQTKLTKAEWESVEIPVSDDEKRILELIIDGYSNVNIKHNNNKSLFTCIKIEKSEIIETFFYSKFFRPHVTEISALPVAKAIKDFDKSVKDVNIKKLKTADTIRIENVSSNVDQNIIEFVFLRFIKEMLSLFYVKKNSYYAFYLYTLIQLRNITVKNINKHVLDFVDICISTVNAETVLSNIIRNAYEFIEKNKNIFQYGDITLYDHQKRLFSLFRNSHTSGNTRSNLVLYIAPTGTGKTLSPIGLVQNHRVIFVCAARHVGMALAKSAISAHKCVAFAFGCETASDIRLHYYAAAVYKINKRSGGIGKVDNSVGTKVELMICDAKSYLIAMYYMLSFNHCRRIITYWDEPTIGMDTESHPLHEITHKNWSQNKIPNMVLSSATLPKEELLMPVIMDFRNKFLNTAVTTIESYDFNKSISILNKGGYCMCPHIMFEKYDDMLRCVDYCSQNKTLLRYFDLNEILNFIEHLNTMHLIPEQYAAETYFEGDIGKIKMNSLKTYYLDLLSKLSETSWNSVSGYVRTVMKRKFEDGAALKKTSSLSSSSSATSSAATSSSAGKPLRRTASVVSEPTYVDKAKAASAASGGILLTTVDAHTLTDGPTIYLTENIQTIGNFYIQQSSIPKAVFDNIFAKLTENNVILAEIAKLEAALEDELGGKELKDRNNKDVDDQLASVRNRIDKQIEELKQGIKVISLDPAYIPNTVLHQNVWAPKVVENAFIPTIDTHTAKRIMELEIDDRLKILLLLGIGSFENTENSNYTEIVKELAFQKRLFIIIASSDYIYGTNYQFCHEVVGKDLVNMSQQKTVQALGRVGRNNIQQEYTVRFRDDSIIYNLFKEQEHNIEAINMCRLLVTDSDEDDEEEAPEPAEEEAEGEEDEESQHV